MSEVSPPDPEAIRAVLRALEDGFDLRQICRPESGLSGRVHVLQTDRQDLVLRTFTNTEAAWKSEKERVVYGLLRRQGVPAPNVLKIDLSKALLPDAYAISERLPGRPLSHSAKGMTAAQRADLSRQLGDLMGRMHRLTFAACGDVAECDGVVSVGPAHELREGATDTSGCGPFATWRETHWRIVRRHLTFLRPTAFGDLVPMLEHWFWAQDTVLEGAITPRLLHMDLHGGNVLVADGQITGVVDVEESLVGHNEFDLMRTELAHFRGEDGALAEAFFAAYTQHVPLDDGYERRKPFYELSRSLVGLRCQVTYGDMYSPDQEAEGRARIQELLQTDPAAGDKTNGKIITQIIRTQDG